MIEIKCPLSEVQGLIKMLRLRADLSQDVLAGRSGYRAGSTISHYENGERAAGAIEMEKIFAALGYEATVILTEKKTED